jgi:hypothetical protein
VAALYSRSQPGRVDPTFALVSVVLHAALFYAIGRVPWAAAPAPNLETVAVLWLEPPLQATVAPPVDTVAPLREDVGPIPRPAPPAPLPEAPPSASPPDDRATPLEPLPDTPILSPSQLPEEAAAPSDEATTPPAPRPDFETERQKAVALVIEQQARERTYRTFSLEDLVDEEEPPAEPGAEQDVFSASGSSGSRPALLRPSHARTRVGRAIAEVCHSLTGGIGVFGLFSLCAEPGERADFFGHLRPAYMDKLPVCTEQELTDAQLAAARITDPSTIERTVVKCRLVDRDEVLVVPD